MTRVLALSNLRAGSPVVCTDLPPMPEPHPRTTRRPAFTLIEVMVVVIVIGVFAGFAAPLLGERRAGAELVAAARQVAQAAQLARQEAGRTGAEARLVVGRDTPDAWSVEADGEDGPAAPVTVRQGSVGGGTLPGGVVFAGVEVVSEDAAQPGDAVRFGGGGGATPAVVRLVSGGAEGGERSVVVHASGRVEVVVGPAGPPAGRVDLDLD